MSLSPHEFAGLLGLGVEKLYRNDLAVGGFHQ